MDENIYVFVKLCENVEVVVFVVEKVFVVFFGFWIIVGCFFNLDNVFWLVVEFCVKGFELFVVFVGNMLCVIVGCGEDFVVL